MQEESLPLIADKQSRSSDLSSFLHGPKEAGVVYFRMEAASQLEEEYDFGPIIGEGTFGVVYSGIRKSDNAKCAIKKVSREAKFSASERARLNREVSILRLVSHPGIIQLFAVAESPDILFLITELCEGDTLSSYLTELPDGTGLEEYVVVEIIRQVTSALSYLHNRGIVHRDLKANNIMLLHKVVLDFRQLVRTHSAKRLTSENDTFSSNPAEQSRKTQRQSAATTPPVIDDRACIANAPPAKFTRWRAVRGKSTQATVRMMPSQVPGKSEGKAGKQFSKPLEFLRGKRCQTVEATLTQPVHKLPPPLLRTKLIDFGLAVEVRKNEEPLANACGTLLYMAPEVLSGRSYTRQCDVWSLGILMYHLLTRNYPYLSQTEDELIEEIGAFDSKASLRLPGDAISTAAQNCLIHTLHCDPAYRYSASELLLDPWIVQHKATTNQEDALTEADESNRLHCDPPVDGAVTSESKQCVSSGNSPAPSVSFPQTGSVTSTTNVLELMKKYRQELINHKQE